MEDHNGFAVWQFKLQGLRLWVIKLPEISEPKNQNGTLESWNRRTSGTLTAVGLQSWVDFAISSQW